MYAFLDRKPPSDVLQEHKAGGLGGLDVTEEVLIKAAENTYNGKGVLGAPSRTTKSRHRCH